MNIEPRNIFHIQSNSTRIIPPAPDTIPRYITIPQAGLEIDTFAAKITWKGKSKNISRKSYALLVLLASSPYSGFSVGEMMHHGEFTSKMALYNQVHHIRGNFNQELIFSLPHGKYSLLLKG